MLQVFLDIVLPVALVAIAGGLVGHWRRVSLGPLAAMSLYLFGPALSFHSMSTTTLSLNDGLRIAAVMAATYVSMYVVATTWSLVVRHDPSYRAAFALAATTPNMANMALPVALLAFGQRGFDIAVVHMVVGAMLINSGAVAIASMAGGRARDAWRVPLRFPSLYAAMAGIAVNLTGAVLPPTLGTPIATLAGAAVPVMLVVLGLQLPQAVGGGYLRDTLMANGIRLAAAPLVAWTAATLIGLGGVERATLTVLAAMPTAVVAMIFASEFGAQSAFVTRAVVTSTIASVATLTALISLLR